ncbi:hypothetical protein Scep_029622 [Stephania cephalantha]|uniref:Uncharacterized protein n=1 Tax=Stephania cephalantha TaxID=152367 RepID=A0AAP0DY72_9MAGN
MTVKRAATARGNDRPAGGEQRRREARTDQREARSLDGREASKAASARGDSRHGRRKLAAPEEAIRAGRKRAAVAGATADSGERPAAAWRNRHSRGVLASKLQRSAGYIPHRPTDDGLVAPDGETDAEANASETKRDGK